MGQLVETQESFFYAFGRLYIAYMWMHIYPVDRNISRCLWTPLFGSICRETYRKKCKPKLRILGRIIQEVHWDDLFHKDNVIDGDPRKVGAVDGAPVYIQKPCSFRASSFFVVPKYKGAIVKFEIVVTNMFRIAHEYGLTIGNDNDARMFKESGMFEKLTSPYSLYKMLKLYGDSAYRSFGK